MAQRRRRPPRRSPRRRPRPPRKRRRRRRPPRRARPRLRSRRNGPARTRRLPSRALAGRRSAIPRSSRRETLDRPGRPRRAAARGLSGIHPESQRGHRGGTRLYRSGRNVDHARLPWAALGERPHRSGRLSQDLVKPGRWVSAHRPSHRALALRLAGSRSRSPASLQRTRVYASGRRYAAAPWLATWPGAGQGAGLTVNGKLASTTWPSTDRTRHRTV